VFVKQTKFLGLESLLVSDSFLQPGAEARRHFVLHAVSHEFHNVPRSIQDGFAMRTTLKVGFHTRAQLRIDFSVDEVRDLAPYL
jgi:hypothetical protein